jgi:hypothetical protein
MSNEIHRIIDEAAPKTTEEANEAHKESLLRERISLSTETTKTTKETRGNRMRNKSKAPFSEETQIIGVLTKLVSLFVN